jgi:hypothetical protein
MGTPNVVQSASSRIALAIAAWQELPLWQPLIRRFAGGERHFVRWCRFPGLVFTAEASEALLSLSESDPALRNVLEHSELWALEEVLFPTLVGLLGLQVLNSPDNGAHLRPDDSGHSPGVHDALANAGTYWMHPVATRYDDPNRAALREHFDQYRPAGSRSARRSGQWSRRRPADELSGHILTGMRKIEGWLADDEAELLISTTRNALCECPQADAIVEVGSYCGRATSVLASVVRALRPAARVWAIDPHDGFVGSLDYGLERVPPTFEKLADNLEALSLTPFVELVRTQPSQLPWSAPVCLLLIDGLHDYPHVLRDFDHFEPYLVEGALVAFHDYADYFPGVPAFVDELSSGGRYQIVEQARSLITLRKLPAAAGGA